MFYTFNQNNSGGYFEGEHRYIIIEAPSAEAANAIAESTTDIYFDGVYNGYDCRCCGDRWYRVDEYDAADTPEIYGENDYESSETTDGLFGGKILIIHLDGRTEEFGKAFR